MPITVTAPSGQLTAIGEREILPKLTHALLEATDAVGNDFLTSIVDALTVNAHSRRDTWVNILHAPDGGWGIGGRAYSDDDLLAADPAALTP